MCKSQLEYCIFICPNVFQMYSEIQQALEDAAKTESIVVTMITGAGTYYCSGNDLTNFTNIPPEGPQKLAAHAKEVLRLAFYLQGTTYNVIIIPL